LPVSSFLTTPARNVGTQEARERFESEVKVMGTILTFPRDRLPRPATRTLSGPAEIVIFPGIRVERYDFSLADRLPPPRRRGRPSRMQALEIDRGDS
jgi:hypothetical protein